MDAPAKRGIMLCQSGAFDQDEASGGIHEEHQRAAGSGGGA